MKHTGVMLLTFCTLSLFAQEATAPDALILYRNASYQEAVRVTREELVRNPQNMNSYTVLGWSLLALGQYGDAIDAGLRALDISPFDNRIIQIVGEGYYRLGDTEKAEEYLRQYITLTPNGTLADEVYYLLGEIYFERAAYRHADILFSAATYLSPDNSLWWQKLGAAREEAGEFFLSLQAYERAQALQPSSRIVESIGRVQEYLDE